MKKRVAFAVMALAGVLVAVFMLRNANAPTSRHDAGTGAAEPAIEAPVEQDTNREPAQVAVSPEPNDCSAVIEEQQLRFFDEVLTEERFDQLMADSRDSLGGAAASDFRLFVAMLGEDSSQQLSLLGHAIDNGDRSPALLWQAVNVCLSFRRTHPCPAREWLDLLLATDYENSEAWMAQAVLFYEEGRNAEALDALRRASVSSSSDDYWLEKIDAAKAGIDAMGGFSDSAGWIMAIGISAAQVSGYGGFVTMCKSQSEQDAEWANACIAYGETAERQFKTLMGQSLARSVQANAHLALGNEQRYKMLKSQQRSLVPDSELNRYPDSISNYIEALRTRSETEAWEYMMEQNRQRAAAGYEANCDFTGFE